MPTLLPAGRRCGGGWSDEALNYAFTYNISTEAAYPYKGVTNPCPMRLPAQLQAHIQVCQLSTMCLLTFSPHQVPHEFFTMK